MVRGLPETDLNKEWQALPKNWYAIYQWRRTSKDGYTERIAQWIIESFTQIALATDGLRNRSFRADDHHGQITLSTGIEQLTEKRIVRAMFNAGEIPLLGKVIDYEVPLKDTADAKHGDIDLLCSVAERVFCIEAKHPKASESILKAVLQAYAYTSLVASKKLLFLSSFKLDSQSQLTPAILTFASAQSGQQLRQVGKYPHLLKLIGLLNDKLGRNGIAPIQFFVIENPDKELANCLTTTSNSRGHVKAVFCQGFELSIKEHPLQ